MSLGALLAKIGFVFMPHQHFHTFQPIIVWHVAPSLKMTMHVMWELLRRYNSEHCRYDIAWWYKVKEKEKEARMWRRCKVLGGLCIRNKSYKPNLLVRYVGLTYVVLSSNWTTIYEWYMTMLLVDNGHHNEMCYDEIELCAQIQTPS
jgi:hypothetical protein